MSKRAWIAVAMMLVWGVLPLLLYLPSDRLPAGAETAITGICLPGWALAYVITGGVHSGYLDAAPALCALFGAGFAFAAVMLVFRFRRRRTRM